MYAAYCFSRHSIVLFSRHSKVRSKHLSSSWHFLHSLLWQLSLSTLCPQNAQSLSIPCIFLSPLKLWGKIPLIHFIEEPPFVLCIVIVHRAPCTCGVTHRASCIVHRAPRHCEEGVARRGNPYTSEMACFLVRTLASLKFNLLTITKSKSMLTMTLKGGKYDN